jgi:methionine aminopeptidase
MYREIGGVIEKHAKERGCSVVRTYCGHGLGELFHTAPTVPHYNSACTFSISLLLTQYTMLKRTAQFVHHFHFHHIDNLFPHF